MTVRSCGCAKRSSIHAARARTEPVRFNRIGEYRGARHALRGVARRIDSYGGSDAALQDLSAQLVAEETAFSAAMPDRKRAYYRSSNAQRSRDDDGQARR